MKRHFILKSTNANLDGTLVSITAASETEIKLKRLSLESDHTKLFPTAAGLSPLHKTQTPQAGSKMGRRGESNL